MPRYTQHTDRTLIGVVTPDRRTLDRWFDKTFSLIITADGTAGINFEHSWGDGFPIGVLLTHVCLASGVSSRLGSWR